MREAHLRISWHRLRNWVEIKAIGGKAYYEHFDCGWYSYQPLDGNQGTLLVSQEELGRVIGKKTVLKEESLIAPHFAKVETVYFQEEQK